MLAGVVLATTEPSAAEPVLGDPSLGVTLVAGGLEFPTSMAVVEARADALPIAPIEVGRHVQRVSVRTPASKTTGADRHRRETRYLVVFGAIILALSLGCRASDPASCDQVPTTADGCRERCHDRGAEMTFFRYAPGTYRCDALCQCGD